MEGTLRVYKGVAEVYFKASRYSLGRTADRITPRITDSLVEIRIQKDGTTFRYSDFVGLVL
jgi:hypothetical protein